MTSSISPFNRPVRLAAHAFYDDLPSETAPAGQPRVQQGTAIVVLDALARRNRRWVREDDLAASLKLQPTLLREVPRHLEKDKIVARDVRKEPAATTGSTKEGEEEDKVKLHLESYGCLEYAQAFDAIGYRMHRMRKKIKDELAADSRATVQQYMCPACGRRYLALDTMRLLAGDCECFRYEHRGSELVVETDAKITSQGSLWHKQCLKVESLSSMDVKTRHGLYKY
ncbi:uncharacterized protein [Aegilops tauschii subsp. strangulata]|uniref:uncharacterized protein n=1 Tax=Aegilops tauschii subsp. strangulata TaxID=200361 RepID=UPI003CC89188